MDVIASRRSRLTAIEDTVAARLAHEPSRVESPRPAISSPHAPMAGTFPCVLFAMVMSKNNDQVCGFSSDGRRLEIRDARGIGRVLSRYFRTGTWASFARQLNNYQFRRCGASNTNGAVLAYEHQYFVRGRRDLLRRVATRYSERRDIVVDIIPSHPDSTSSPPATSSTSSAPANVDAKETSVSSEETIELRRRLAVAERAAKEAWDENFALKLELIMMREPYATSLSS